MYDYQARRHCFIPCYRKRSICSGSFIVRKHITFAHVCHVFFFFFSFLASRLSMLVSSDGLGEFGDWDAGLFGVRIMDSATEGGSLLGYEVVPGLF